MRKTKTLVLSFNSTPLVLARGVRWLFSASLFFSLMRARAPQVWKRKKMSMDYEDDDEAKMCWQNMFPGEESDPEYIERWMNRYRYY